jgi:hypothetical protein
MSGLEFEISGWGLTDGFGGFLGDLFFDGDFVAILGPIEARR